MKKQVSKTTPVPAEDAAEPVVIPEVAAEAALKPKARKKKADVEAAPAEEAPAAKIKVTAVEAAPEVKEPAKKTVKKASKKASKKPGKAPVSAAGSAFKAGIAAQLDAVKKIRKAKGRDLVVDEPGAEEVADVLGTSGDEPQEGADEIVRETEASDVPVVGDAASDGKQERLQKILAKAGISSRRKAEELILEGRVQINGKVVTELGTKADMERDHVRVDGKLLQGAERIRYFVLNKPKGFVTTVSDPEGRPTVMQFFSNENERLYPVGRLDYLSEGLLLVTNDGELANKLTKAASGVEKTYLVKVAGQPTEDMLDVLRGGVVIERGRPGTNSGRVRTAPAKIRQVRQGDNPWYEVIIIEGRNRELRKMFEEIGHHVEKIRRIGYGPLVLDLEPGKLRELEPDEVTSLRLAAEGKLKVKKRKSAAGQLPTVAGKTVRYKKADGKPGFEPRGEARVRPAVRPEFQVESKSEAYPSTRSVLGRSASARPTVRSAAKFGGRPDSRPASRAASGADSRSGARPVPPSAGRPELHGDSRAESRPPRGDFKAGGKPAFKSAGRPEFGRGGTGSAGAGRSASGGRPAFGGKPRRPEPPVTDFVLPPRKPLPPDEFDTKPSTDFNPDYKPGFRAGDKPAFRKDGPQKRFGAGKPSGGGFGKGSESRAQFDESGASTAPPFNASADRSSFDRDGSGKSKFGKSKFDQPSARDREDYPDGPPEKRVKLGIEPVVERTREERPRGGGFDRGGKTFRPRPEGGGRPDRSGSDRASSDRTERSGAPARPGGFGGGAKPFAKPFRPSGPRAGAAGRPPAGDRPYRSTGDRPDTGGKSFRPRTDGPPRGDGEFRPRPSGPRSAGSGFGGARSGPPRSDSRSAGGSPRGPKRFEGGSDRPGEFKPREFKPRNAGAGEFKPGAPKRFGAKPGSAGRAGADGPPRGDAPVKKERWRNSFTGKNKGRPKPKGKKDE